jgi:protoporphyrinogen oxidase
MSQQRIIIIGAGPTGLGAAWRLHELSHEDWLLIEADQPGGLAASCCENGFTWDYGVHVFYSHYEYVDRLLTNAWGERRRESWVWMRERFIPYPLQYHFWQLPEPDLLECLNGLVDSQEKDGTPGNFREWIDQNFGQGLADVFMIPYNRKVWACDPAEMGFGWIRERVTPVDFRKALQNAVLRRCDDSWGPNATFKYPLQGGAGAPWRDLYSRLPRSKCLLGRKVVAVNCHRVTLDDGDELTFDKLISSMPLDELLAMLGDARAREFKYASPEILGVGIKGKCPDCLQSKSWIYYPEPEFSFYRATILSNYAPKNVPDSEHYSLMLEVDAPKPMADILEEIKRAGLLSGDVACTWHRKLKHGYPTPFVGRDELLMAIDDRLRNMDIWSRGRFGGWKYEVSNQDQSMMQGVEAVDHLLRGLGETTFYHPEIISSGVKQAHYEL